MSVHEIEIPKEFYDKLKPCWKCGKKPIIIEIKESFCCKLYTYLRIQCPDDKCCNVHFCDGENIDKCDIEKWNELNIEKYVPKSELKISKQNCKHCKHVKSCIYTREERIGQFFYEHICDDFEHE